MQIKLFTIPVGDSGNALQEMNAFLRGNKILEVENKLVTNEHGAYWCFCVRYIEGAFVPSAERSGGGKVDYRKVLDDETFQKFSKLREIRKKAAAEAGVAVFIVFTDEQLAELAKLDEITEKTMLGIKGIGEKKVEQYSKYFVTKTAGNEEAGLPDRADSGAEQS
jgi:superfamily II DNA helicase RecQ